jgi:hypothetical protein
MGSILHSLVGGLNDKSWVIAGLGQDGDKLENYEFFQNTFKGGGKKRFIRVTVNTHSFCESTNIKFFLEGTCQFSMMF